MDAISLSHALDGYLLHAGGRQLSENTLLDYRNTFRRFREFLPEDPPMESITLETIEAFFAGPVNPCPVVTKIFPVVG